MTRYKAPDFTQRAAAAKAAKQSAIAAHQAKAPPDPEVIAQRQATQAARDAAAVHRRLERQREIEETRAAKAAAKAASTAPAGPSKDAAPRSEAELKAARDARYAARKARKR